MHTLTGYELIASGALSTVGAFTVLRRSYYGTRRLYESWSYRRFLKTAMPCPSCGEPCSYLETQDFCARCGHRPA